MYSRKCQGNLSKPLLSDLMRLLKGQRKLRPHSLEDIQTTVSPLPSGRGGKRALLLVTCLSPRPRCSHSHAHMWPCRNCLFPWGQAKDRQWTHMVRHLALTFEFVTLNLQVPSDGARTCFKRNENVHFLRQRKIIAGLHLHLADFRETQERLATGQGE